MKVMSIQKKLILVIVASFISLALVDILIGVFISGFKYDSGSNKLETYFSYGYSTEGKLEHLIGATNDEAASISHAGWYSEHPGFKSTENTACETKISIYGMSFTDRIGHHLAQLNNCYSIAQLGGPGAPFSHSFETFNQLKSQDEAQYVVIGILASALPKVNTVAHFNSAFEYPGSHFYPRYSSEDGQLISSGIPVSNLEEFRQTLGGDETRKKLLQFLKENDDYYHPFVFQSSWTDYSNTLKMLRRSFAQSNKREAVARYFNGDKFLNHQGMVDTLRLMLRQFVVESNSVGKTPIIILINDRNYAESLDPVFMPVLEELNVKYFSSTSVIDSRNLSNFIGDGHFTEANDIKLAQALDRLLQK